mgnify:CR=1 FL=1
MLETFLSKFADGAVPPMLNLTVVLLYATLLVIITSVITLRSRDPDPMLGGRNMPWWLVGASIVGTNISSISFLLIPSIGFTLDVNVMVSDLLDAVGAIIACFFFVVFLRKTRNASIYTLLKDRFGTSVSLYISGAFIVFKVLYAGIVLYLVGKALHFITGADVENIIFICGILVIFYTYMTGIEGVIWTDFFQTLLLIFAGLLALFFIGQNILGNFSELGMHWSDAKGIFAEGMQGENVFSGDSLLVTVLFFITSASSYFVSDQTIAQRYLVARSDSHAKKGLIAASLCMPFFAIIFIFIGLGLYLFYALNPTLASPEILADKDGIFAYFIAHSLPNGFLGLAIVGILAAAMSTMDTAINSSSTVFYCNFWEPFTQSTESKTLRNMSVMRHSSLVFGVLAILSAYLIYTNSDSALNVLWKGGAFILDGVFGLFILMRISQKVGKKAGITALVSGTLFTSWATLTSGLDHPLAAPFHYMWGLPVGTLIMVTVGLIVSCFVEENIQENEGPTIYNEAARKSIARKRKRAKKNIFADSLRPKNFYQVYASIALLPVCMFLYDTHRMGFSAIDPRFLVASLLCLVGVIAGPFIIKNFTSKYYLALNLTLLTIALPLGAAVTMFLNPMNAKYGYLYLGSVLGMGTMIGWTMLGLGTMLSTALATLIAMGISENAGIPENWMILSLGTFAIFIFYAMDAAKERLSEERALGKVHNILRRVSKVTMRHSIDLSQSGRQLNMQDISRLTHTANDIATMIDALKGATNTDPEDGQLELSVKESLQHALNRIPANDRKHSKNAIEILGDQDFKVMGNRDVFENILYHLLENAFYYLERGEANKVVCSLDAKKRIFTISNDGPPVKPANVPYIFDLGYTTKGDLGLGLTYCKKMLEGMRAGIRLTSKPQDKWVTFKIYFPFSYDGRKLNDDVTRQNEVQL